MKRHLATIMGVVLTIVIAVGVFVWDFTRRDNSSYHRVQTLQSRCQEETRAATGASETPSFQECERFYDAHLSGASARMTSAAMVGAASGAGFALLFLGGLRFLRRRGAQTAAGA